MTEYIKNKLKDYILSSSKIVFLGGAGVSTESGIPDFRSKDGLYNNMGIDFSKYHPEYLLSLSCLYNEPEVFFSFYKQKMDIRKYKPNITHTTLTKLEHMGKLSAIITQNIDGLHQKAGSKNVYEIHGTTSTCTCMNCGKKFDGDIIFETNENVPLCPDCRDMYYTNKPILKPDVVLYGEDLPMDVFSASINAINDSDCLIIGGTSLQVYPANTLISYFKGEHLIIINNEPLDIPVNDDTDLIITDTLGNVFTEINNML